MIAPAHSGRDPDPDPDPINNRSGKKKFVCMYQE